MLLRFAKRRARLQRALIDWLPWPSTDCSNVASLFERGAFVESRQLPCNLVTSTRSSRGDKSCVRCRSLLHCPGRVAYSEASDVCVVCYWWAVPAFLRAARFPQPQVWPVGQLAVLRRRRCSRPLYGRCRCGVVLYPSALSGATRVPDRRCGPSASDALRFQCPRQFVE